VSLDRYGPDVLSSSDWKAPKRGHAEPAAATRGMVVEEVVTGWCGAVVRVDRDLHTVELEDRRGKRRTFPLGPGFLLEGRPVILHAAVRKGPVAPTRTASGSVPAPGREVRVARAGRIYVEGRHDAELVEKVWGDDHRVAGSGCSRTTWSKARRSRASRPPSCRGRIGRTCWSWATRTSTSGRR
jgi:hypothetical protein